MPRDFLQQLFSGYVGRSEKFLAEHDCQLEVDLICVNAVFRLPNNDLSANAVGEVERGQIGIDLLFCKYVGLVMQINKTQLIFPIAESGF